MGTVEDRLARIMHRFGPFVAIGKPGEELPEMGAARMYVGDDDWQAVVSHLLNRPDTLAVLQAGETQGLRWELSRIGCDLKPDQVLLFLPFGLWSNRRRREKQYDAFRAWAEECLPVALPDRLDGSCFIYFTGANGGHGAHTSSEGASRSLPGIHSGPSSKGSRRNRRSFRLGSHCGAPSCCSWCSLVVGCLFLVSFRQ